MCGYCLRVATNRGVASIQKIRKFMIEWLARLLSILLVKRLVIAKLDSALPRPLLIIAIFHLIGLVLQHH